MNDPIPDSILSLCLNPPDFLILMGLWETDTITADDQLIEKDYYKEKQTVYIVIRSRWAMLNL